MGRAWVAALVLSVLPIAAAAENVSVFAAASLKTALETVAEEWRAQTGSDVTLTFAGSATIARQVDQGAPADIVFVASEDWMDWLEQRDRILPVTRRTVLSNRLVLIGSDAVSDPLTPEPGFPLAERLGRDRLAMALVDAVPAGIYGKAALTALGVWSDLQPKVAQTDNVRTALALVATGEAPFGIVYATDALAEPRVTTLGTFPARSHPDIRYSAAVTSDARHSDAAAFLGFLSTDSAWMIFEAEGFVRLD